MLKSVDQKTLQAAVKALKINAPIYSAIRMEDGTIQITTRNGIQTWTPPTKRKTQTPRKSQTTKRAQTSSAKGKGAKKPA